LKACRYNSLKLSRCLIAYICQLFNGDVIFGRFKSEVDIWGDEAIEFEVE
jgi:hypothetical protein